mgnify:CR=1 FL=1|tara:strand:+ start:1939 stop:2724 length:786 start_codon:yes stop_codon:yes gene_type:complete
MSEYLHPSINDNTLVEILKEKVRTNTPFALTRFGDGEIFIINKNAREKFLIKNLNLWGYKYPSEINSFYNDCNRVLKNAFIKSDIIGLMNKDWAFGNLSHSASQLRSFYRAWSINTDIVKGMGLNPEKLKICNHMVSRSRELGSIQGFKDIIQGKDFHIISPNVELHKSKNLEKFFDVNIGYTHHPHSLNFNNRKEFISNFKNIKEDIVIMGIGLQKDYGVILRDECGKIAIDMGATMDAWAGIKSRAWFKEGGKQDYLLL